MKNSNNIKVRADAVESEICSLFGVTTNDYINWWYEWGCEYAEGVFEKMNVSDLYKSDGIRLFITSEIYWYHWAMEWLQTAEVFVDWSYSNKSVNDFKQMQMQLSSRRAWPLIHELIVEQSKVMK
jgi:hypothetical protein